MPIHGRPRDKSRRTRGFTLIEMMTAVLIAAVLVTLAWTSLQRAKPRANLASSAADLQALIHSARQAALASGDDVGVLIYPNYTPTGASSPGYVVLYQDPCYDFFAGGATCGLKYGDFDPSTLAVGGTGTQQAVVLDTLQLPSGVIVGPATGMGATEALKAPIADVAVNVACSFCGATGGAIRFDRYGQATFYALDSGTSTALGAGTTPKIVSGASLTLTTDSTIAADVTGTRTLVILSGTGAVQILSRG